MEIKAKEGLTYCQFKARKKTPVMERISYSKIRNDMYVKRFLKLEATILYSEISLKNYFLLKKTKFSVRISQILKTLDTVNQELIGTNWSSIIIQDQKIQQKVKILKETINEIFGNYEYLFKTEFEEKKNSNTLDSHGSLGSLTNQLIDKGLKLKSDSRPATPFFAQLSSSEDCGETTSKLSKYIAVQMHVQNKLKQLSIEIWQARSSKLSFEKNTFGIQQDVELKTYWAHKVTPMKKEKFIPLSSCGILKIRTSFSGRENLKNIYNISALFPQHCEALDFGFRNHTNVQRCMSLILKMSCLTMQSIYFSYFKMNESQLKKILMGNKYKLRIGFLCCNFPLKTVLDLEACLSETSIQEIELRECRSIGGKTAQMTSEELGTLLKSLSNSDLVHTLHKIILDKDEFTRKDVTEVFKKNGLGHIEIELYKPK
ncbi:unnamed protein product [Moneuplotes crassus]|uniref:Uncharacterized protein n=1 Tax=Euplotes crassus TaxID=5936 RepID=A0AAD1XZM5_EUPCR|nr:unnamed protein product [Moneuplotes crassus]